MYPIKYEHLKNFLQGGKASFIIVNTNSNNHLGFKIKFKEIKDKLDKSKIVNKLYYVYYKSHSNIYIGFIDKEFNYFKRKANLEDDFNIKATIFDNFFRIVYKLNKLPNDVEVFHTGQCCRCGRELTDPIYMEKGIGKICAEKLD